jgi:23S rRNA pseudouridine955/2504/2580 synthase
VVVGTPRPERGRIELPLAKVAGRRGEHVAPVAAGGRRAVTLYRVAVSVRQAAWLVLEPQTGRTHQLRAHCVSLGTPILGDGKYGGARAFVAGAGIGRGLHLHARVLRLAHPAGGSLEITAPLPPHMAETWRFLGFDGAGDPGAWCDRRGAVRGS